MIVQLLNNTNFPILQRYHNLIPNANHAEVRRRPACLPPKERSHRPLRRLQRRRPTHRRKVWWPHPRRLSSRLILQSQMISALSTKVDIAQKRPTIDSRSGSCKTIITFTAFGVVVFDISIEEVIRGCGDHVVVGGRGQARRGLQPRFVNAATTATAKITGKLHYLDTFIWQWRPQIPKNITH